MRDELNQFCHEIGGDRLLVQGAGGNVSWKDGQTLWIKASGKRLATALSEDIYVPVDLPHLLSAVAAGDFAVAPVVCGGSTLRPSIETLFHAMLPHRVVVHLHAIEILSVLVRKAARAEINHAMAGEGAYAFVDYFKPGAELARAIGVERAAEPDYPIIFLKNHGIIVGGDTVQEAERILRRLCRILAQPAMDTERADPVEADERLARVGYHPCEPARFNHLARSDFLAGLAKNAWALYPDHVVFLGDRAWFLDRDPGADALQALQAARPPFVLVPHLGVYQHESVTPAQTAQLQCYLDVVARQGTGDALVALDDGEIAGLLDWDAERYRIGLNHY